MLLLVFLHTDWRLWWSILLMVILKSFIWIIYQLWITIFFFYFNGSLKTANYVILIVNITIWCISSVNGSIKAKKNRFYYRLNSFDFKRYDTLSELIKTSYPIKYRQVTLYTLLWIQPGSPNQPAYLKSLAIRLHKTSNHFLHKYFLCLCILII